MNNAAEVLLPPPARPEPRTGSVHARPSWVILPKNPSSLQENFVISPAKRPVAAWTHFGGSKKMWAVVGVVVAAGIAAGLQTRAAKRNSQDGTSAMTQVIPDQATYRWDGFHRVPLVN